MKDRDSVPYFNRQVDDLVIKTLKAETGQCMLQSEKKFEDRWIKARKALGSLKGGTEELNIQKTNAW